MFVQIYFVSILILVSAVGKERVRVSKEVCRTYEQWRGKENLALACNALNLPSAGSRHDLALRLFGHYQAHSNRPSTSQEEREGSVQSGAESEEQSCVSPASQSTNSSSGLASEVALAMRGELKSFLENFQAILPLQSNANSSNVGPTASRPGGEFNFIHSGTADPVSDQANSGMPPDLHILTAPNDLGVRLPPMPAVTLTRIQKQEFVPFESLLPGGQAVSEYTIEVNASQSDNPSFALVPRAAGKSKIADFHSRLSAWNVYVQTMTYFFPHLTGQLLQYQATVTRFASQYSFDAWSTYDRLFRLSIGNNQIFRWDHIDDNLFNFYLRTSRERNVVTTSNSTVTTCYSCNQLGHYANACPSRNKSRASGSSRHSSPPFRAPQRVHSCHIYNNRGQCDKPNCRYAHICAICQGPHAKAKCPGTRGH